MFYFIEQTSSKRGSMMVIEISVAIAVIIFAILTIYIIQTLIALQKTLKRVDTTVSELEIRMKSIDPGLHTLSNIGKICEDKTSRLKQNYFEQLHEGVPASADYSRGEIVDWIVASIKLGEKFFNRR